MDNKDLLPEKAEQNFVYWTNADGINKEEMDDKGCGEEE